METLKRKNEIIILMKSYDFKNKSIKSFSELYGPSTRTISRYLNEYNIEYNKSNKKIIRERDVNGQFLPNLKIKINILNKKNIDKNEKHVSIKNFKFNN